LLETESGVVHLGQVSSGGAAAGGPAFGDGVEDVDLGIVVIGWPAVDLSNNLRA